MSIEDFHLVSKRMEELPVSKGPFSGRGFAAVVQLVIERSKHKHGIIGYRRYHPILLPRQNAGYPGNYACSAATRY